MTLQSFLFEIALGKGSTTSQFKANAKDAESLALEIDVIFPKKRYASITYVDIAFNIL